MVTLNELRLKEEETIELAKEGNTRI